MALATKAPERTWVQFFFGLIVPFATLGFALVVDALPLIGQSFAPVLAAAMPSVFLAVLVFWAVHQPDSLPIMLVFGFGLCADALHNTPFGMQAICYMLALLLAKAQGVQARTLGFGVVWGLMALVTLAYFALVFVLSAALASEIDRAMWGPAFLRSLLLVLTTIAAYPLIHLVLRALERLFLYRPQITRL